MKGERRRGSERAMYWTSDEEEREWRRGLRKERQGWGKREHVERRRRVERWNKYTTGVMYRKGRNRTKQGTERKTDRREKGKGEKGRRREKERCMDVE